MSTVLARYRNISGYEYFNTALRIRTEITALVTSAAMPKSYRFILAVPMAQAAREIVGDIVTADAFYPNTEHNFTYRRHYLTLAVMAKIYYKLVKAGRWTIEDVPELWRAQVQSMLDADA